ncbi:MAG: hypothetical protein WCD83_26450, partial [Pseudolabrys sp.]
RIASAIISSRFARGMKSGKAIKPIFFSAPSLPRIDQTVSLTCLDLFCLSGASSSGIAPLALRTGPNGVEMVRQLRELTGENSDGDKPQGEIKDRRTGTATGNS